MNVSVDGTIAPLTSAPATSLTSAYESADDRGDAAGRRCRRCVRRGACARRGTGPRAASASAQSRRDVDDHGIADAIGGACEIAIAHFQIEPHTDVDEAGEQSELMPRRGRARRELRVLCSARHR